MSNTKDIDERAAKLSAAISARVADLRRAQGLSQSALARVMGTHQTYISGLEGGRSRWNIDQLVAAAVALGVGVTDLLQSDDGPQPDAMERALIAAWRAGGAKAVIAIVLPHLP